MSTQSSTNRLSIILKVEICNENNFLWWHLMFVVPLLITCGYSSGHLILIIQSYQDELGIKCLLEWNICCGADDSTVGVIKKFTLRLL